MPLHVVTLLTQELCIVGTSMLSGRVHTVQTYREQSILWICESIKQFCCPRCCKLLYDSVRSLRAAPAFTQSELRAFMALHSSASLCLPAAHDVLHSPRANVVSSDDFIHGK